MPENGGIDRTILLPPLPEALDSISLLQLTQLSERSFLDSPGKTIEHLRKTFDDLSEYLKLQRDALQISYDELAKRMNELPEMVWITFGAILAANVTNQALGNGVSLNGFVACEEGSVVAVAVRSQSARTAGTLTIEPTINSTGTGFTTTLDATDTTQNANTQDQGTDTFAQKDLVGCQYSTTADWAPAGTEIDVTVGVVIARGGK